MGIADAALQTRVAGDDREPLDQLADAAVAALRRRGALLLSREKEARVALRTRRQGDAQDLLEPPTPAAKGAQKS